MRKLRDYANSPRGALEPLADAELVGRVLATADSSAFELIMRRHNQRLYRTARSVVKSAEEAEDVVQETYVIAYQKLSEFRGPGGFAAWLAKIAFNEALRRLRGQRRVVPLVVAPQPAREQDDPADGLADFMKSSAPDPETLAQAADLRRLLEKAIDSLPDEFRTVFVLAKVEELAISEISDILSINPATVKTRLHRARQQLRDYLGSAFADLAPTAHRFDGVQCDRIVASVLTRLGE